MPGERGTLIGRLLGFLVVLLACVWLIRELITLIIPLLPILAAVVVVGVVITYVIRRQRGW